MSWWRDLKAILFNETPWELPNREWQFYGELHSQIYIWVDVVNYPTAAWLPYIEPAINWWNSRLPRFVLHYSGVASKELAGSISANPYGGWATNRVLVVADNIDERKAHTELYWKGYQIISARVPLPYDGPTQVDIATKVVRHELGHVLGLGHARHPKSIMWKNEKETEGDVLKQELKMLKGRYE